MATQRMTQTQLVRGLAEAGEITNKQSRAILDSLSSMAIAEVRKNGVFVLPGIGRLVRVDRKARLGRNPATGESIKIPAKKVVKFREIVEREAFEVSHIGQNSAWLMPGVLSGKWVSVNFDRGRKT